MFLINTIFGSGNVSSIIDFCLAVLLVICLNLLIIYFARNKWVLICNGVLSVVFIVSFVFEFSVTPYVALAIMVMISIVSMFVNISYARRFLTSKDARQKKNGKGKVEVAKIFDQDKVYETINQAVQYLSKNKIGALITFERKDDLRPFITNGSILNSPITFELLITLFYPGTRLHDGAVVIKGDKILAASVYYTPSTKPMSGKYGSRHRAAIGISEVCDAVTVVVSEETGRISITYNGRLESYSSQNFYSAFTNIMNESKLIDE